MANENNKVYTNINLKRALGRNGDYIAVTMEAFVHKVEPLRELDNGKKVLNFTTFINNRAAYIKKLCGDCPAENENGGLFARVSMWDSPEYVGGLASRFSKYMANKEGKNVVVVLTGSIKVKEEQGQDGTMYKNIYITADDFWEARVFDKKGDAGTSSAASTQPRHAAPAPAAPQAASQQSIPSGGVDGFIPIDDDDELPF